MAKMYTTSKTNPITGDPVNNSSYPGSTGSKREQRKNAAGKLTASQNKALNKGVEKQGQPLKQYYKGTPVAKATATAKVESKSRLERKMEKYGVEPASSKLSPSQQKEFNKNRVKLAKERERAAKPTPGRDKINDKVNKVLGRGKYDKGGKKGKVIESGKGGRAKCGKMDDSCKKPAAWTR